MRACNDWIFMISVCVDAMGGDEKPEVVLQGIERALAQDQDLCVVVAGEREAIADFCATHERTRALFTTEVIEMDEHPAQAVRDKKDSSIVRGCMAVKEGQADGFFSAGSTGAIFAASTFTIGRIRGIKRPCIAGILPGRDGHQTIMLDLGANADVRPDMIVQFAHMGIAFARAALNKESLRIALLSNGTEDTKGSTAMQAFFAALQEAQAQFATSNAQFVGNCEGNDILTGDYDLIVTDGLTGNIALKTMEGTAKYIMHALKRSTEASLRAKLGTGLLLPSFKAIATSLSGDKNGGAVLLGLKAPVLIGHGATSSEAVMNGTLAVVRCIRTDLCAKIAKDIS
ncbi:fatty acid/phospholipid synthesis protein PlsX [Atopobium deltae]|uniref:Phosphate acyltransferase n=2 Tax=Atopobium deltae TaxID=1393034 RepID=A0A133XSG3_9ACTN|nr:fatty acid/phospholipid synthesis protein PlsX [Atopobium deltae]